MNAAQADKLKGLSFHVGDVTLSSLEDIRRSKDTITVKVDGHALRSVPGPTGVPLLGNYLEGKKC